jgi:phosphoglycerate kinase
MGELLEGLKRVQDAPVEGKRVLVRVDYNVPLKDGEVSDDSRIRASLPTLKHLLDRGARPILLTHLGRPEGKVVPDLRLDPVASTLRSLIEHPVTKLDDCIGPSVEKGIDAAEEGGIILLENVRFHPEETANESGFSRKLAALGEVFVNDAFATLHRAHASTLGVSDFLPSYAGMLVQHEVEVLSRLTDGPERPYVAIIGGKKARSKLGAVRGLIDRVDGLLIGGGVAFTFLRAKGLDVGKSIVDESLVAEIGGLIRVASDAQVDILLPQDVVVAEALDENAATETCDVDAIQAGWMGLDIGPETVKAFAQRIASAKTIVWAGPMGAFEVTPFAVGTEGIAQAMADSSAFTVVGGGETGEAVTRMGYAERMSYISTGGGACLALLRGKRLPALEALRA